MAKTRIVLLAALLAYCCSSSSFAQRQSAGCTELAHREFDFWIGEWVVTDNNSGNIAGSNKIQNSEGGCMLFESWVGAGGGSGTSVNYYNPVEDQWRQLWVSEGRYSIDIVGGLVEGSMRLVGTIFPFSGVAAKFRGTWTPCPDGSVRQFFEQYDEDTESWTVWFDGRYTRKEN